MDATIVELLNRKAAAAPHASVYCHRVGPGHWTAVSWKAHVDAARRLAHSLVATGVVRGERVAIVGRTCPKWQLAEWATLLAGGVVVGIEPELPKEQLHSLLIRLTPRVVIAIGDAAAAIDQLELNDVSTRYHLGQGPFAVGRWRNWDDERDHSVALPEVRPDDLATLILTSGTTGEPKAVQYTHRQLAIACRAIVAAFPAIASGDPALCWLPMSHLFQRMMNLVVASEGGVVHFVDRPSEIVDCIREVNPTIFCGVPRFYEKLAAAMEDRAAGRSSVVAKSVHRILNGALEPPTWTMRAVDQFVRRRLRRALGGRMRYLVTGGAPLSPTVAGKLARVGWEVLEAYGVSENAVPMSANRPGAARLGSVGIPLTENEIKIAGDGEVLVRGEGVAAGYWPVGRPAMTPDGFLCTGDLGRFDEDGYLYLMGRKSEFVKTSTGRKVNPAAVAEVYQRHPLIETVVVFGEGQPRLSGLVVVDERELKRRLGLERMAKPRFATNEIAALVSQAFQEMSPNMASHERIAHFRVLERPLSVGSGELTPSLKICRSTIARRYAAEIAAMYDEMAEVTTSLFAEAATV